MNYYVKRFGMAFVTLFAASTLAFILYRLMPGGPVEAIQARLIQNMLDEYGEVDMERVERQTQVYTGIDPDQPIHIAYYEYVRDIILYQDFGYSIHNREPVFDILFAAMPWSIFVSVYGLLLGFTVTVLLGSLMAYKEGTRIDYGSTAFVLVLGSIPYYVVAVFALAVLSFEWGLFPTGGRYDHRTDPGFNIDFMLGVVHHGALPILTSFIVGFGGGALGMRANAVRVMGSDYIRSAEIRGVKTNRITTRYLARNAVLPIYTGLMIGIAAIFSSSVIMEWIFTYPGVGWYTFDALDTRDYPLLMGAFLFFTTITVVGILIADLTYGLIDPRAGTGADREEF